MPPREMKQVGQAGCMELASSQRTCTLSPLSEKDTLSWTLRARSTHALCATLRCTDTVHSEHTNTHKHTQTHTNTQTHKHTQTHTNTHKQTNKQTSKQTNKHRHAIGMHPEHKDNRHTHEHARTHTPIRVLHCHDQLPLPRSPGFASRISAT